MLSSTPTSIDVRYFDTGDIKFGKRANGCRCNASFHEAEETVECIYAAHVRIYGSVARLCMYVCQEELEIKIRMEKTKPTAGRRRITETTWERKKRL
jgi:hypothetical protein